MRRRSAEFLVAVVTLLLAGAVPAAPAFAQGGAPSGQPRDSVYVIYDSSNSMWGELADRSRKYEAGRDALARFLESDIEDKQLAFRAYGHTRPGDCRDSTLMVPFAPWQDARARISAAVGQIRPTGKTPIDFSLREALKDFGGRAGDILLISDGIETCDADPCALMREWKDSAVQIRVHVVGVGLREIERDALACIAEVSGGSYFDAQSADELADVLSQVQEVATADEDAAAPTPVPDAVPAPVPEAAAFALRIQASDDQGRSFVVAGELARDGAIIGEVRSHRRNVLEGPGDYAIDVGVVLADDSIYKPVRSEFTVSEPGETVVEVVVTRPAIVSAEFTENGEPHGGAFITAFADGAEAFGFRPFDEALARPGTYEFRSEPNPDNPLALEAELVEGEHTVLRFDLTKTVKALIVYRLPDGQIVRRNAELWADGEQRYFAHANNGVRAQPGLYELRSDDDALPLGPTPVEIPDEDGTTIEVPITAGFLTVSYAPGDNYKRKPDRAFVQAQDRRASIFARLETPLALAPGLYEVLGWDQAGDFAPQSIEVIANETAAVVLVPAPMGSVVVEYAPSENYKRTPDRALLKGLDGQENVFVRLGSPQKVASGRYEVQGWRAAGDIAPQEITVGEGETARVVLHLKSEE